MYVTEICLKIAQIKLLYLEISIVFFFFQIGFAAEPPE
jgi:hypothetical protein